MTDHPTYTTAVRNLQRYLRAHADGSEGSEVFAAVPIDGIYDTATEAAVSEFQKIKGLPVTGIVDRATSDALFLDYLLITAPDRRMTHPDFFPAIPENYVTDFGEKSSFISVLQFTLDEIRLGYDTFPAFEMSGIYDADTSLAVKEFQRIHSLPMTGRVDRRTWNEIALAYNSYARYTK